MLSKKASLREKFKVDKINGKLPKIAIEVHANVEKRNVCCKFK